MPMTKAEMEAHHRQYQALMSQARTAEESGSYAEAIEKALACSEHIDGMMQYERRFMQREFKSIGAIEMTAKYAPLLFDKASLAKMENLLKEYRRIEKNTSEQMGDKVAEAREMMREAHRLWNHIEKHPGCRQDELRRLFGGKQEQWRSIAEVWEKMGLIRRTPKDGSYCLAVSTRMDEPVRSKCPACAHVMESTKVKCLGEVACPQCKTSVVFVILSEPVSENAKE